MDDLDKPNTLPGFCPVCAEPANIWNATRNVWMCSFCNWQGRSPDKEPHIKGREDDRYTLIYGETP